MLEFDDRKLPSSFVEVNYPWGARDHRRLQFLPLDFGTAVLDFFRRSADQSLMRARGFEPQEINREFAALRNDQYNLKP